MQVDNASCTSTLSTTASKSPAVKFSVRSPAEFAETMSEVIRAFCSTLLSEQTRHCFPRWGSTSLMFSFKGSRRRRPIGSMSSKHSSSDSSNGSSFFDASSATMGWTLLMPLFSPLFPANCLSWLSALAGGSALAGESAYNLLTLQPTRVKMRLVSSNHNFHLICTILLPVYSVLVLFFTGQPLGTGLHHVAGDSNILYAAVNVNDNQLQVMKLL